MPTQVKQFRQIPTPKERLLLGSFGLFKPTEFHLFLARKAQEMGNIYRFHLLGKPVVVVSSSDDVYQMLKDRPQTFRRLSKIESVFKELGVHGVFSAEGEEWKAHRKILNPAFKPSQLKRFFPVLSELTERLVRQVPLSTSFDFQELIRRYSVDVTTMLAFGYDLNTLEYPDSELQSCLDSIFPQINRRLQAPVPYWKIYKGKQDQHLEKSLLRIQSLIQTLVQSAEKRACGPDTSGDILESLVSTGASFEKLFGNVVTLLLAGEDTTANTIAWTICFLCRHPEVQQKVFEEIETTLPMEGKLSFDDLDNFVYLEAALRESMRIKPVAPLLFLEPKKDVVVSGYQVPKGTMTVVLLSQTGKDEKFFPNAEGFKPERWLIESSQAESKLHPFGGGPRLCPGMQLAFVEMKLAIVELLRKYRFSFGASNEEVYESFEFTVKPKNLYVTADPRMLSN